MHQRMNTQMPGSVRSTQRGADTSAAICSHVQRQLQPCSQCAPGIAIRVERVRSFSHDLGSDPVCADLLDLTGPAEEDSASAEVFEGTAETAIPTAMETEQEATISTDSKTETQPEKLVIETHTEEAAVQTKIDEAAVETQTEEVQNVQPASSPKSRVQQLVESFETKAVAEPVVPQSKPVLSRASSIVKEAVAAIEEVVTAAPAAVEIVEIEAPIAATTESAVQEAEETKEETKAEEEAILSSITDAAVAPETEAVVETTDAEVAAEIEVGESKDEEQDSLIPATVNVDSPSFTNAANVSAEEVVDEATSSRISQVFGSLRSSLPLLSAGSQTLMFKSEEFKATDEEAAALHEAFENSTPRMEEPLVAAEESEVNESSDSITLQLAAQFAEVADSPITARTAAATAAATSSSSAKRVPSASPSRRVAVSNDIASSGSVPSFLRPTAGSISRAQAIAEAAAAAQAAAGHITRRPISVARAAAPVAPASTPKINKKSVLSHTSACSVFANTKLISSYNSLSFCSPVQTRCFSGSSGRAGSPSHRDEGFVDQEGRRGGRIAPTQHRIEGAPTPFGGPRTLQRCSSRSREADGGPVPRAGDSRARQDQPQARREVHGGSRAGSDRRGEGGRGCHSASQRSLFREGG